MTTREVAQLTGLSARRIQQMVRAGRLKARVVKETRGPVFVIPRRAAMQLAAQKNSS